MVENLENRNTKGSDKISCNPTNPGYRRLIFGLFHTVYSCDTYFHTILF